MRKKLFIYFGALAMLLAPASVGLAFDGGEADGRNAAAPDKKEPEKEGKKDDAKPKRGFRMSREGMQERIQIVRDAGIGGRKDNGPAVGTDAPDFALTPLKFYDFQVEEEAVTKQNAQKLYDKVKLSSFRGKRPVALIFGSYT